MLRVYPSSLQYESGLLGVVPDHKVDEENKELSGHNIFAPPPEVQPRPLAARALVLRESISICESAPNNCKGL
ncbi:hypothetical protein L1987_39842 [Smallanthus sonchifolius]|uniref:Uncharacterized protein n=1 Tax=Smallanthus sonchifolius TaxID=185202 RepID=A0ACB9GRX3_9ASTR|nr:hypothetical protein L1987_39842 [Smallanthus sonchifolius]